MGCVQAKPSPSSPRRGLEKMKMEGGYVPGKQRQGMDAAGRPPRKPRADGPRVSLRGRERESNGVHPRAPSPLPPPQMPPKPEAGVDLEEMVDGWPRWLVANIPKEVLAGIVPKTADNYEKLDKVGQGTYSNVYKARDRTTGKIVALKKVRFDTSESESVRFMAREIMILQRLNHPNIIKLDGLATSRMQYSIYLVFDFMQCDLARVISRPEGRLTEPQIKCYMQQLLSGLQHCHESGILHRDIKGSNLLIDRNGMLKIADFGLANFFNPNKKRPLTSRVVTLWYRAPELLLGTTDYGAGIDLWSAGCLLAEMFAGRPIMPGRTEVEQLHRIFKLCGSPSEDYWRKLRLSTSFRPPQPYKSSILEAFRDFPSPSLELLTILLALDPEYRSSAASALQNKFFTTSPLACDLSGLPVVYKEENDEAIPPHERRKHRSSSKMKQRPRPPKDPPRKSEIVMSSRDSIASQEEEKPREHTKYKKESDTSTESCSPIRKDKNDALNSPTSASSSFPSPAPQPHGRPHRMEGHPLSNFKNLPTLNISMPNTDDDDVEDSHRMYRYGMMDKRASTPMPNVEDSDEDVEDSHRMYRYGMNKRVTSIPNLHRFDV